MQIINSKPEAILRQVLAEKHHEESVSLEIKTDTEVIKSEPQFDINPIDSEKIPKQKSVALNIQPMPELILPPVVKEAESTPSIHDVAPIELDIEVGTENFLDIQPAEESSAEELDDSLSDIISKIEEVSYEPVAEIIVEEAPVEQIIQATELEPIDIEVIEIFSQVEERIATLEPAEAEVAHEIIDQIIEAVQIIHTEMMEIEGKELAPEAIEKVEQLVIELCEQIGLECREEQAKHFVRLMLSNKLLQINEKDPDLNFDFLFDDQGTHEGLRYFMTGIMHLQKLLPSIHALIGKYALIPALEALPGTRAA
jgi:hypothetical protein